MEENYVQIPEDGFVIALGYYAGDESQALRLARLLANIERAPRHDVTLALCRRADCPDSDDLQMTLDLCRMTFPTMAVAIEDPMASYRYGEIELLQTRPPRIGHPDGANALWSGTVALMAERWQAGNGRPSVFTIEADGTPLCTRWIDVLKAEHDATLRAGKRITGCLSGMFTDDLGQLPHINGSLIIHAGAWLDHPSMAVTPIGSAWDLHHAATILGEARQTKAILNPYGAKDWTDGVLSAVAKETAWISNTKDQSAIAWAERTLVKR